jgi:hypothetical protein
MKTLKKYPVQNLVPILFLTFFLTLTSNFSNYGSPDDFCTYAARFFQEGCGNGTFIDPRSILEASISQAESQGRFYQIIFYSLTQMGYVLNLEYLPFVIRTVTLIFLLYSIYLLTRTLFNRNVASFSTISFLGIYSISGGYNTLTGFPLWFLFGESCLVYSVFLAAKFEKSTSLLRNIRFLGLFSIFFMLGIYSYEAIFFQLPGLFFLFYLSGRYKNRIDFIQSRLLIIFISLTHIGIYAFFYLTFLSAHSNSYEGTKISSAPFDQFVTSLWNLSFAHIYNSINFFVTSRSLPVFFLLLFFSYLIYVSIFTGIKPSKLNYKGKIPSIQSCLFLLLLSFLPNLPLILTERYRSWAMGNPMYLGSLYSAVLQSVILGLFIAFNLSNRGVLTKKISLSIVAVLFAATQIANFSYFNLAQDRQWVFSEVIVALERDGISCNRCTFDTSTLDTYSGSGPYRFWSAYIYSNTGIISQSYSSWGTPLVPKSSVNYVFELDVNNKIVAINATETKP